MPPSHPPLEPPHAPIASPATLRALEFPSLLALVAAQAATDLGRYWVLALLPTASAEELGDRRQRYAEVGRLLVDGALVPSSEEALAPLLDRLASGRPPLLGPDLVRLAELLRATRAAATRVRDAEPACPGLTRLTVGLPDAAALQERVERTLDRRGEVREDASPALQALRRTIRRVRDGLYKELSSRVGELRESLSEETIPLRNNRLVLVLQAGARGRVSGLLHGRSATGKSFYFEPLEVVDSNNQLQQAIEDEEEERRRILIELIAFVRDGLPVLEAHADFLAELDLQQAAVRFADACGGALAGLADGELVLVGARHPLLDPGLAALRGEALGNAGHTGPVVPLDLALGGERRALVITGPNAGGKTVALKTAGLLTLAHQCGLPVPAGAGTRLPIPSRLVATVGDEQDLLEDRSTFSGRLQRLREAWDAAGPGSLLLLDELGSGTDPEEGSALATALLEGLLERDGQSGGLAVVTTHLTRLAAAALELPGAGCAAMEFEASSGRPTFRLLPGPPGGSEALALGRRLGLPAAWLDRAEALLGPEHRDLRRLLGEIERAREETTAARARLEQETADLAKLAARHARELAALEAERKTTGVRLRAQLEEFRRETSRRLSAEVERLREEWQGGKRRALAPAAVGRLFAEAPEFAAIEEEPAGLPTVGQRVRHRGLGWQGVLEKLDGKRAEVRVQGKKVRCNLDDLTALSPSVPAAAGAPVSASGPWRPGRDAEEPALRPELKLIGERVEPALEALDLYLDQALRAAHGEVRIVHGHGTGRLRDAVRGHLRAHPAVAAVRPGEVNEGGNGATVVTLREA